MEPTIVIVDEDDKIIGHKKISKVKAEDIYRVAALWIKNSKGQVLLARRALTKRQDPGKWGPAVAGTLEEGETYEENVKKETEEELGLKNISPSKGSKVRFYGEHNFFCQYFFLKVDREVSEFKIQKEEVDEVKWFSEEEILKNIESRPEDFLPDMKKQVELFRGA